MGKLQFCGDVWLPSGAYLKIPETLSQGLVLNLEAPLTQRGNAAEGKICLSSDPEAFRKTFSTPPIAVCLANNHIMDYGEEGFADTLSHLDAWGVPYFGAGKLGNQCNNPLIVDVGDTRVGLMGYVCPSTHPIFATQDCNGVAPIDLAGIASDLGVAIARGARKIVVCLHWGAEQVWLPKPGDIEVANSIMELGVDLVIGHHAHCRQPVMRKSAGNSAQFAFFGLGNAFFPDSEYRLPDGSSSWWKQRSWNRTSTWVTYIPDRNHVSWDILRENNGELYSLKYFGSGIETWNLDKKVYNTDSYARRFRLANRIAILRNLASRFLARPKIPSVSSLRYILRSLARLD